MTLCVDALWVSLWKYVLPLPLTLTRALTLTPVTVTLTLTSISETLCHSRAVSCAASMASAMYPLWHRVRVRASALYPLRHRVRVRASALYPLRHRAVHEGFMTVTSLVP